jgi:hypothetical protein
MTERRSVQDDTIGFGFASAYDEKTSIVYRIIPRKQEFPGDLHF